MTNPAPHPIRILLADDEPDFLMPTAEILRLEGFVVETALSGGEGMAHLDSQPFDLLISDIQMPGNAGLSFVKAALNLNPNLRVLLVSGHPSLDTALEAIHLPVTAFLTKPVAMDDLVRQVGQVANSVHLQRAASASRERLMKWVEELDETLIDQQGSSRRPDREAARLVFSQAMGNIAGVLMDMKAIFDLSLGEGPDPETCSVRICPRLAESHLAIEEAVQVIAGTKHSFKSKELAELRERLIGVLVHQDRN